MSFVFGVLLIAIAVMLVIGAFPVGLMMCGFVSDSGACSNRRFWTVFTTTVAVALVQAGALAWWGWGLIG